MPPGPQQYRLPALSSFMPSGAPAPSPVVSRPHAAAHPALPSAPNLEKPDVLALGIVDEELLLVGREAKSVGLREVVGHERQVPPSGSQPVDAPEAESRSRGTP